VFSLKDTNQIFKPSRVKLMNKLKQLDIVVVVYILTTEHSSDDSLLTTHVYDNDKADHEVIEFMHDYVRLTHPGASWEILNISR
jgi:hypothetical protein